MKKPIDLVADWLPAHCIRMLGRIMRVETTVRGKTASIEGRVIGMRPSGSTITNMETGKSSPGVMFLILPADGRPRWTKAFPQESR